MSPILYRFFVFLLAFCCLNGIIAQPRAVLDTLQTRNGVLAQLIQSESYEQAQVEAEGYRVFLKRNNLLVSPHVWSPS